MTQQYKFESQSSHFSKKQFSLHCTVKHLPDSHKYIYHLSNVMTHNYVFTSTVLKYLIDHSSTNIIRMKSGNCATQYKPKYDTLWNLWSWERLSGHNEQFWS